MTAATTAPTTCIHTECPNEGRYETPKGWVCGEHFPQPSAFRAVKTFCATKAADRDQLGERVTEWLREHSGIEIVDKVVVQSSDNQFHCISVVLFYR